MSMHPQAQERVRPIGSKDAGQIYVVERQDAEGNWSPSSYMVQLTDGQWIESLPTVEEAEMALAGGSSGSEE